MPRILPPLLLALSLLPVGAPLQGAESAAGAAAPAMDSPTRPAQSERSAAAADALAEYLPAQEQQQLQAGEESFLALWLPANAPQAHGVVILLGGDGESPDWPTSLGPLRRKLPDAGWHSLALGLPDPLASLAQAREEEPVAPSADDEAEQPAVADEADQTNASPPAEAPEARHGRRINQRIAAALALARQQKTQRIVLLGHGSGAYWAARYLDDEQPGDVHNLLLVAAEQPAQFEPTLDDLLPRLKQATGDFYYSNHPGQRMSASNRARASKRQAQPAYIQVAMTTLPGNPALEQEQLFRRLRGWLSLQLKAR